MRWNLIKINIVGSVANTDEINQIETVAKTFLIAERMIKITLSVDSNKKDKTCKSTKKGKFINNILMNGFQNLNVKGLN